MQDKAFFKAVKDGDLGRVRELLAVEPALVEALDKERCTPLHWAAWRGHAPIVEVLLDAGADIAAHNDNGHWGTTALHAAAHGNQKDVVEVLLRRGADVNAEKANGQGTPLAETRIHNATAAARLLRDAGARE